MLNMFNTSTDDVILKKEQTKRSTYILRCSFCLLYISQHVYYYQFDLNNTSGKTRQLLIQDLIEILRSENRRF